VFFFIILEVLGFIRVERGRGITGTALSCEVGLVAVPLPNPVLPLLLPQLLLLLHLRLLVDLDPAHLLAIVALQGLHFVPLQAGVQRFPQWDFQTGVAPEALGPGRVGEALCAGQWLTDFWQGLGA